MTETTTVATSPLPYDHTPGSVGVLIANTEAQVRIFRYLYQLAEIKYLSIK